MMLYACFVILYMMLFTYVYESTKRVLGKEHFLTADKCVTDFDALLMICNALRYYVLCSYMLLGVKGC
jgi:hypothetical protein